MEIFTLPDLGEGLEDAEIVAWHVGAGDHVVADQPLVSVETDKAVVEIPSPVGGRVARRHGEIGDVVLVGAPLVEIETEPGSDTGTVVGELRSSEAPYPGGIDKVSAAPAVRSLAAELGVDLGQVRPSGPNRTITRSDVERAAGGGHIEGEPIRGMRRAMFQRMARAHREVVPAGVTDDADIGDWAADEDITIRLVRAIAAASRAEPWLNAWFDSERGTRKALADINIGIAVDTEDGLIVPVLRDVGARAAADLRIGLNRLRADAKARTIPPSELRGASITLSNFGMYAGRYAHLVVVPPQVAIIGAGRVFEQVVALDGKPVVRRVLPLTLIFDHRIVTGGEGARFMRAMKCDLENGD